MTENVEKNSNIIIDYDDFAKLNIKIGKILSVEEIPKSNKLLKITVNVGEDEERIIVAGIKESYSSDDLVGTQIVVLTNLRPRKVFGIKSNGMLLAASLDGKAILLRPDKEVIEGSKIK